MNDLVLHPAVVCPMCRSMLRESEESLHCEGCAADYPVDHGIPRLLDRWAPLTIDPGAVRLKTEAESMETINLQRQVDFGFLSRPRHFYLIYAGLAAALLFRVAWGALLLVALLLVDWLYYRYRQGRILDRFESNPIRLRTVDDTQAVDRLFERLGRRQPTMDDWTRLAWKGTAAPAGNEGWRPQVAERYLDILRIYRAQTPRPHVVVDVGANDGQATYEFGIGAESTLIGVDISHLLLRRLRERLPHQVALQADGLRLPLKDASVDFLYCTETLEHLTDPAEGLAEFHRVLRPGGVMIAQSPNAHRLRNLNLFEMLVLPISLLTDRVVRKKIVQENTWHNASTYHWDLSVQDYRRMLRGRPVRILDLSSREFFFPQFLLSGSIGLFRLKERIERAIPILRYFGADLVLVAQKLEAPAAPGARRAGRAAEVHPG